MPLTSGTRLGTYQILAPLGTGGMGEVYRAKDLRLNRDVAVKVLPAEVASSPERLARFEREARTVAGFNHPNIVTLFSVEDEDGIRFLTMELVEGRELSSLVSPGGLPLAQVLSLAIPLADALAAAHERRVVHRDLKPGNVMVTREGRVKVLDFGLARLTSGEAQDRERTVSITTDLTGDGQVAGTVPYMAPEQIRGEALDARSDLFALGVILYELATGRRPFRGRSSVEIASAILRDAPEPLTRIRADLPPDLERVVAGCLAKNPEERIQSAPEVGSELRRLRTVLDHGGSVMAPSDRVASIAVLPFVNRSRDEEDEYFSDGLADEILNVLTKIKGLRVSARSSAFTFRGKQATVAEIGRALNVATVLDGSVRKAGNRVRISVQLVKVSDGYHLWSETYDRTLEDIFAVQDDIAQSVVRELRAELLGEADSDAHGQAKADVERAVKGRGTDPEAHRLYLLARHMSERATREDTARAIEYLRDAVARDQHFALAWVELGGAIAREADMGWTPMAGTYDRAREAVERALAIEPDLAEGHAQMARMLMLHDGDWRQAEMAIGRALQLAPGNAWVLRTAGSLAMNRGRLDEAAMLIRRSLEQDPLSAAACMALGMSLLAADRFSEAEAACRKGMELAPKRGATHAYLALTLMAQGRGDEALAEAERDAHEGFRVWALAMVHHRLGNKAESDAALRILLDKFAADGAFQIAEVHAMRGEADAAFEWLERAHAQRDGGLAETKSSPRLRSIHTDPRWPPFLKRIRLAS